MRETGDSRPRSRTGLRFRERFVKLVQRPSSASGKSHLNVTELSTQDSSSPASIGSSRSDGTNTAPQASIKNQAAWSLSKPSIAVLLPQVDISSATAHTNRLVAQMWHRALEAVTRDEEMKETVTQFESLLQEFVKQEQAVPTRRASSSKHQLKDVEDALNLVDRTLQDARKAQEALDTTLGVFAVVKGLSSFVRSMLSECPPAALAWAGMCACIPIIAAPIEEHQSMIKGLRYIYARAPVYFDLTGNLLQDRVHSSDMEYSIRTNIQPLYEDILKYIMLSICSIHRGKFSRFWKAISGQTQWEILFNNIERVEKSSLLNIRTIHGSRLLAITENLSERYARATDRKDDQRRRDFLYKLKGMNYETRLKTTLRRLDGTCQWFRQHARFRDWLSTSGGLLLVSASAGCGKSVLAKYLTEELLYEEYGATKICYFFFKDSDPQARSCLNAAKAILHQFLESNPDLIDTCMRDLPSNPDEIPESDFKKVWSVFRQISTTHSVWRTVCVLDALDESDPEHRNEFLECLKDYVIDKKASQVKFLVTTRGYPQILNLFREFNLHTVHLDGDSDEEKRQIQKEISIVMDHRLNELETTMPDISGATLEIIRTGLVDNGAGQRTYLWMHLMFDYIHKNRFCTREEWREIFRNPPDTVDRAYEKLLQSVTPPAKEKVRTLLALILAARRPLNLAELSTAVNCRISTLESRKLDLDDIPNETEFGVWIRWECGSFVTIYDGKAFLIHQTAKEFLLETTETADECWQGSMTHHVTHQYMAESCIAFLSLEKFRRKQYNENVRVKLAIAGNITDELRLDEILGLEPFMVYSAMTWMNHFRSSQQSTLLTFRVFDIGKAFFEPYLSLFIKKLAGRYAIYDEWRQQAWYLILMASLPENVYPFSDCTIEGLALWRPDTFTVSDVACFFDHRRLLAFVLDALEKDADSTGNNPSIHSENTSTGLSSAHFAAYGGSWWCLSHLQALGYNIDLQDCSGQTPLHKAASLRDMKIVTSLLKFGASKTKLDNCNSTPLAYGLTFDGCCEKIYPASIKDNETEIRSLLYFCAIAEAPLSNNELEDRTRQLLNAIQNSEKPVGRRFPVPRRIRSPLQPLYTNDVYIGLLYDNSLNVLHLSVQNRRRIHNTIFLLAQVDCGERLIYDVDGLGNTPLHTAILANNITALEVMLFLRRYPGAEKNAKGERGDTPLHMACKMGHRRAAEVLMKAGVDLEIRNDDGLTAAEVDRPPRLGVELVELIRTQGSETVCEKYIW